MAKVHLIRALQVVAAVLVAALAIGLYRAKSNAAKTESHVRELQLEIGEREATLRELRAEIAQRESPANVEALAEERLDGAVAGEGAALPESAIDERLPPPRARKAGQ
jgi:hypothetical protein